MKFKEHMLNIILTRHWTILKSIIIVQNISECWSIPITRVK
jgi:hypothetical protein